MSRLVRLALAIAALAAFTFIGMQAAGSATGSQTVAFCPGPRGCHS